VRVAGGDFRLTDFYDVSDGSDLVKRCLNKEPNLRPSMKQVLMVSQLARVIIKSQF